MTSPRRSLQGCRVLVVDDCPQIARLLHDVLNQWGASVVTACDGHSALRTLEKEDFDLLMLDIVLPDMNFTDLRRKLTAVCPDIMQRTVLMTGDRWRHQTARELDTMPAPVLFKPFSFDCLIDLVAARLYPAQAI